jgi:hypothetical protein
VHIAHTDAQALAASTLQEVIEARARAKAEATRRERLALSRMAQNAENPEFAVKGPSEDAEEEEPEKDAQEPSGGSLNAKA